MHYSNHPKSLSLFVVAIFLLLTRVAPAVTIVVLNPSFESPAKADGEFTNGEITAWFVTGFAGVFNPVAGSDFSGSGTTDGVQDAYAQANGLISQILSTNLAADTSYTLRIDVGDRANTSFASYTIGLYAGSTLLAEDNSSLSPSDGFLTSTINYVSPASHDALGQPLELRLASTNSDLGVQVIFDNVRFDAEAVPEPSALLLLAMGLSAVSFKRRR